MINYDSFFSTSGRSLRESAIRQMGKVMAQTTDLISFAPGYPAEDSFPWSAFATIAREVLDAADGSVLQYGPTRGYRPLREALVGLMRERGITATSDNVIVTTGSQQGLDLIARVLLDPGDVVLVELPTYTGAISAFRAVGASLVGIRQHEDGIDLDHLETTLRDLREDGRHVKCLYLVPNFQNPTGQLLSLEKRRAVRQWAERRDVLIIEDDPYRDLFFPDVTAVAETRPIAADDADGWVVYLSSFSKTLAPGFRVGWIHAPAEIAAKIELAKQAEDLCSGGLDQRIAFEACRRGLLARHVPELRTQYQAKRDVMRRALTREAAGHVSWTDPRGGFFLWARLAPPLDSRKLLAHARAQGVIFVVGPAFFVDGSGDAYLRLSFSAPAPDRIDEGVKRLARAIEAAAAG